jgi:hypothetical protein
MQENIEQNDQIITGLEHLKDTLPMAHNGKVLTEEEAIKKWEEKYGESWEEYNSNRENIDQQLEVEGSEPIFASKAAEIISMLVVITAATVGREALGPGAGIGMIGLHGILFGGLKVAWEEGASLEEMKSKEGMIYMLKKSLQAAALPFLAAGAIENRELIGNTLNTIDQTIGLTEGLGNLLNTVVEGTTQAIKDNGLKVVGGAAAAGLGIKALKYGANELHKALQRAKEGIINDINLAKAYATSYEPQIPIGKSGEPILKKMEINFGNPFKWKGFFRPKRPRNGDDS